MHHGIDLSVISVIKSISVINSITVITVINCRLVISVISFVFATIDSLIVASVINGARRLTHASIVRQRERCRWSRAWRLSESLRWLRRFITRDVGSYPEAARHNGCPRA